MDNNEAAKKVQLAMTQMGPAVRLQEAEVDSWPPPHPCPSALHGYAGLELELHYRLLKDGARKGSYPVHYVSRVLCHCSSLRTE